MHGRVWSWLPGCSFALLPKQVPPANLVEECVLVDTVTMVTVT